MSTEQFIKISKTKIEHRIKWLNGFIKSETSDNRTAKFEKMIYESILSEGQPVEQISDEDIECSCCGSNDNHLQRVCHKCRNKWTVDINTPDEWLNDKPAFNKECLFVTGTKFGNYYQYKAWQTILVNTEDGPYLGLFDGNGNKWGALEDLKADLYKIISPINNDK